MRKYLDGFELKPCPRKLLRQIAAPSHRVCESFVKLFSCCDGAEGIELLHSFFNITRVEGNQKRDYLKPLLSISAMAGVKEPIPTFSYVDPAKIEQEIREI